MKKVFRKLHLWLSVPFGLIISVVCFTGAALVFETELMHLFYPDRYYVESVGDKPMPVGELAAAVSAALPDSVAVASVTIPSNPRKAYQVGLSRPHRASAYVDQYTGEVKELHTGRTAFFDVMFRTHRWLMDSVKSRGDVTLGKTLVGISTIMFVVALITGIVIWIPRTRKALGSSLKISAGNGMKRFWHDLHVAGGMYAVILLLAMALTGLTWSFSWYRTGFYKVLGVEMQQQAPRQQEQANRPQGEGQQQERGGRQSGEGRPQREAGVRAEGQNPEEETRPYVHWQEVYTGLAGSNPRYKQISISEGSASVSFNRWGNQRASDRYAFDPATGAVTGTTLYRDQPKQGKVQGWIYSVHVGNWGGTFSKIITFLAAMLGGSLPLTGYYLWIKRGINKRRQRRRA